MRWWSRSVLFQHNTISLENSFHRRKPRYLSQLQQSKPSNNRIRLFSRIFWPHAWLTRTEVRVKRIQLLSVKLQYRRSHQQVPFHRSLLLWYRSRHQYRWYFQYNPTHGKRSRPMRWVMSVWTWNRCPHHYLAVKLPNHPINQRRCQQKQFNVLWDRRSPRKKKRFYWIKRKRRNCVYPMTFSWHRFRLNLFVRYIHRDV